MSNKILIGVIEKGSNEDPADEVMIQRWANLLASAAMGQPVQPRYLGILEELAGSQAIALEEIAFNEFQNWEFPGGILEDAPFVFGLEDHARVEVGGFITENLKLPSGAGRFGEQLQNFMNRPGVDVGYLGIHIDEGHSYDWDPGYNERRDTDLSILISLGLIKYTHLDFEPIRARKHIHISLYYYSLTDLGFGFCQVCCRDKLLDLAKIDEQSRRERKMKEEGAPVPSKQKGAGRRRKR